MLIREHFHIKDRLLTLILAALTIVIMVLPTWTPQRYGNSVRARALVIATDNSDTEQYGIVRTGNQGVMLRIMTGPFKGVEFNSNNIFMGKLELDKFFVPGDRALVTIDRDDQGNLVYVNIVDHYRVDIEFLLMGLFVILLIAFAGWTGIKAVLSFIFTGAVIWKLLLPGFLHGLNPILLSMGLVFIITGVIIFLIGGITRKGAAAFLGSMGGIILTCLFSIIFSKGFHIHGAVKPFSETLLYSGYAHLDLSAIFLSGIFLASSGAVMDIAMDISASMEEVQKKHPEASAMDLIKSGFRVGRSVVGTMTTTLLLAYSGGYTAMLMVFMAQGTPGANIINLNYVSAEILHTMVGSFGLVLTAPMTALIAGFIYTRESKKGREII